MDWAAGWEVLGMCKGSSQIPGKTERGETWASAWEVVVLVAPIQHVFRWGTTCNHIVFRGECQLEWTAGWEALNMCNGSSQIPSKTGRGGELMASCYV